MFVKKCQNKLIIGIFALIYSYYILSVFYGDNVFGGKF